VQTEQLIQIVEPFANLCQTYDERVKALVDQLSEFDRQQQVLLHSVEYTKLNASQGYKFAKELQVVRIERRKVKKQLAGLNSFNDSFLRHNKMAGINLFKTVKNLTKTNLGGTDYELVGEEK